MNPQQKKFADRYLETFKVADSYQEAYPESKRDSSHANGTRLLKNEEVRKYLIEKFSEVLISTDELVAMLCNLARNGKSEYTKIRAIELLGKSKGLWLDRTDITSGGERITLADFMKKRDEL